MNRLPLFLGLALGLSLGGCTASRYPSLARRPAERMSGTALPAPAASEPADTASEAPSADVASRTAQLLEEGRGSQRGFAAEQAAAERAVAAAGAAGSDNWARASIALARLQTAHDAAVQALAQLDQLEVADRTDAAGAITPNSAAIVGARDEVAAIVDAQAAVIARLRDKLDG
jgi:hypothetical protein